MNNTAAPAPSAALPPILAPPWIVWPLRILIALIIVLAIPAMIAAMVRALRPHNRKKWWNTDPLRRAEPSIPGIGNGTLMKKTDTALETAMREVHRKIAFLQSYIDTHVETIERVMVRLRADVEPNQDITAYVRNEFAHAREKSSAILEEMAKSERSTQQAFREVDEIQPQLLAAERREHR